jgi:hypothetical protein
MFLALKKPAFVLPIQTSQMAGDLLETCLRQLIAGATGAGKARRVRTWQHQERAEAEDAGAADNDSRAG